MDNIKMDPIETGWGGVEWIGVGRDRERWRVLVHAVMNFRIS
jgi:hypothetical protein